MSTGKYLYGASVQGIQNFIFQTSKLQEIVGASELVEQICTIFFKSQVGNENFREENLILGAAGNIKYLFDDKPHCRDLVIKFPKAVMEMAPGITIGQAVVEFEEGGLNNALQKLEDKLREQRNKVSLPFEIGFMGTERARRTGGVAFQENPLPNEEEFVCEATIKKIDKSKNKSLFKKIVGNLEFRDNELLSNIDDLFKNENKSWLAVIHADGNGLGAIIQNLNKSLKGEKDEKVKEAFKTFSEQLDKSTKIAAEEAFAKIVKPKKEGVKVYPIRPVVLSGDDLTIIIRADLALDFTIEFLKDFEVQSEKNFKFLKEMFNINGFEKGITACAGIAYVKKSYPFHYAVDLAEKLCNDAKKFVKEKVGMEGLIPKSSLAFYKVQDSFIESDLERIKKRALVRKDLSFDYGPYLIEENNGFAHIGELVKKLDIVAFFSKSTNANEEANGISKLRQWVSEVFTDKTTADFMLERMKVINERFFNEIRPDEFKNGKSIIYDIIQLHSLNNES